MSGEDWAILTSGVVLVAAFFAMVFAMQRGV